MTGNYRISSVANGLALLILLLVASCGTPTDSCTFSYQQQQSANVSTILWPVGAARASLNDPYAPDFRWRRSDGTLDSLSGHQGQVVLLNFWAAWCGPCKEEMPAIQSVADEMGDSVFVIGVSVDQCDPFNTVSNYISGAGVRYQIAVDSLSRLFEQYWLWQPLEIPVSYFIGPDGRIKTYSIGAGNQTLILSEVHKAEQ
jgi:thiol-disulfide isomerase/thioredoxin